MAKADGLVHVAEVAAFREVFRIAAKDEAAAAVIPQGEGNLASTSRWRRQLKYRLFRYAADVVAVRPAARRPRRAHHEPRRAPDGGSRPRSPGCARSVEQTTGTPRGRAFVRVAVLHPQTAFVRGGAETHAEGAGACAPRGRPRGGPGADRRQVVPGIAARAPDGGVAELRHHRVQRSEGRRGDRPEVPGVPRRARAQDRVADASAPHRVRAVGPPRLRRPIPPGGRCGGARHGLERRPFGAERGQARVHELEERAGAAVELAAASRPRCSTTRRR